MSMLSITLLTLAAVCMPQPQDQPLTAGPDLVEQAQAHFESFREDEQKAGRQLTMESVSQWAKGQLAGVDVAALTPDQISELSWMIDMVPDKRKALMAHLATGAEDPTADGLQAGVLHARMQARGHSDIDFDGLLGHPGFGKAVEAGKANELFTMLAGAPPETLAAHRQRLERVVVRLLESGDPDQILAAASLTESLGREEVGVPREQKLKMMDRAVEALRAAAASQVEDRLQRRLSSVADYMGGAAARGELIGNVAPEVEFLWVSDGGTQNSLKDFKGKVVVLDFWATWCGPCVGSFPQVAQLQERYKGHDVVILGVTSVQGSHYSGDGPPVDVEGAPEREFELMQKFMGDKDVTWTVAFSKADVFNPDFGVRGIPHVAILDTDGRVIENGLHPGLDPDHKHEIIDSLLRKAGRTAPAASAHDHDHDHHGDHDHDGDGHPDH